MKNEERLVPVKRVLLSFVQNSLSDVRLTLQIVKVTITVKLNQQAKTHLNSILSSSYCNYYLRPVNMLDLCYNNI